MKSHVPQAVALALWGLVLLRSSIDGRLDLLLRGVFHPLVSIAGLLLLVWAMLLVLPLQGRRSKTAAPVVAEAVTPRHWQSLVATALIAVLLICLPPNPSFADLAQRRPGDDSSEAELAFVLPPAQRSHPKTPKPQSPMIRLNISHYINKMKETKEVSGVVPNDHSQMVPP